MANRRAFLWAAVLAGAGLAAWLAWPRGGAPERGEGPPVVGVNSPAPGAVEADAPSRALLGASPRAAPRATVATASAAGAEIPPADWAALGAAEGRGLRGVVVGPDGRPVAEADVSLKIARGVHVIVQRTISDAHGRFLLPDAPLEPPRRRTLHAKGDGLTSWPLPVRPAGFHVLVLRREGKAEGIVRDATGALMERALVTVHRRGFERGDQRPLTVTTDAGGRYSLSVPAGRIRLFASCAGAWHERWLDVGAGQAVTADVTLDVGAVQRVMHGVVTKGGRPVPDAAVTAWAEHAPPHVARSDARGSFVLPGLPPGEYLVRAARGGERAWALVESGKEGRREDEPVRLDLAPMRAIAGQVQRAGRGADDVRAEWAWEIDGLPGAPTLALIPESIAEGRFQFSDAPVVPEPPPILVRAREGTYLLPVRGDVSAEGRQTIPTLDLPAPGLVRGRVTDMEERPVPGARVMWGPSAGRIGEVRPTLVPADAEGRYELPVPSGRVALRVEAPGYAAHESSPLEVPAGPGGVVHDVRLALGGALTGRVVDTEGTPVDAIVIVKGDAGIRSEGRARTDAEGRWVVDDLTGSRFRVLVDHEAFHPAEIAGVPPDSVVPDLVLERR